MAGKSGPGIFAIESKIDLVHGDWAAGTNLHLRCLQRPTRLIEFLSSGIRKSDSGTTRRE
jgi:hypothetical protein